MRALNDFPVYAVTENGEVYNTKTGKKLKTIKHDRYWCVTLYDGKGGYKIKSIHRIVAEAYIPNPENLPCVNHKDENKKNNKASNLEWCTYQYNNHYGRNKPVNNLNEGHLANSKPVRQISADGTTFAIYVSGRDAARQTGVQQSSIVKCCLGKAKTAGGYKWRYETEESGKDRRQQALMEDIGKYKSLLEL